MTASTNIEALANEGVAVWLDDLSRDRLADGSLARLVEENHLVGVTTNPSIFQAALAGSGLYDAEMRTLAAAGLNRDEIAHALTTDDVASACYLFSHVAERTGGVDGRVSIEVDPRLAHDTAATLAQARRLWSEINRPNLLVKIPATKAGIPAIQTAIAEGISVNVTLIFSVQRYREVMEAYIAGLEQRHAAGEPIAGIASVASFFISRVDTEIDSLLESIGSPEALALRGKAALANARVAYHACQETFAGPRWEALQAAGAHPQRPLWASTGVKNPAYPDTLYVTELVAPGTVNTMPEPTFWAVADHGEIHGDTITGTYPDSVQVLADLAAQGIDIEQVADRLEHEGVHKFITAWTQLLDAIDAAVADAHATAGTTSTLR